jgi:putative hemolysin
MWLLVLSVFGALSISAFCSLMEATLLSLSAGDIGSIAARRPRLGALWQRFKADIERPIAAILILNTASHTIGAAVAGAKFDALYGGEWIWAFSLVFTLLMLQFTEILPKGIGVRYNRQVAAWIAGPLAILVRVARPVAALVRFINRPFETPGARAKPPATVDEIAALAGAARLARQISTDQERIIKRGTRLSGIKVRDILRPRVEIDALDVDTPPEELVGAVVMSGFSRVPVYEGDFDHILGFVYNKDLLLRLHMGWPIEVRKLLRPALLVPEAMTLVQLLEAFRKERTQMAVVLDEYGGTEGLVTLTDVLEELVGTVYDEHRSDEPEIVPYGKDAWLVDGAAGVRDLLETAGRPELSGELPRHVSTAGGLVQTLLDRIPNVGDGIAWNGLAFEVVEMESLRIQRIRVTLVPERTV